MDEIEKRKLLEAIIFSAPSYLAIEKLNQFFNEDLGKQLEEIKNHFEKEHGFELKERGGKIIFLTKKDYAEMLKKFWQLEERNLSQATLETLAIIAYLGPISRSEISKIRGVNSTYLINKLLLRGFIISEKINGKKLIKLSDDFKNFLGLERQEDLPYYQEIKKQLNEL